MYRMVQAMRGRVSNVRGDPFAYGLRLHSAQVTVPQLPHPTQVKFEWLNQISPEVVETYAHENCAGGYLDPTGCSWYHRNWAYLRSLNLLSNPYWHPFFYLKHFGRALARFGFLRVLICGTADDALLSLLALPALQLSEPKRISFTVIDKCLTPLLVCRDFSRQYPLAVAIVQTDAHDLPFRDGTFDVVASDAFLARFCRADKEAVLAQWQRVLRPGGIALTTARIEPSERAQLDCEPQMMSQRERLKLGFLAAAQYSLQGRNPWSIVSRALEYSGRIRSYPFRDADDITETFRSHGFDVQIEGAERRTRGRVRALVSATKLDQANDYAGAVVAANRSAPETGRDRSVVDLDLDSS